MSTGGIAQKQNILKVHEHERKTCLIVIFNSQM